MPVLASACVDMRILEWDVSRHNNTGKLRVVAPWLGIERIRHRNVSKQIEDLVFVTRFGHIQQLNEIGYGVRRRWTDESLMTDRASQAIHRAPPDFGIVRAQWAKPHRHLLGGAVGVLEVVPGDVV